MTRSNDYILEARGLHKSFGSGPARVHVLRGLDLHVHRGEFLAIMGPSGCGKSTLLHVMGLMARTDEGSVCIDGADVSQLGESHQAEIRRRQIGFIFQRFNLISVLSGYDNVKLSLAIRGLGSEGVQELLQSMDVAGVAFRKPGQLSIGQQQRLAVARGIAHNPAILLADEPTGSLDSANATELLGLLSRTNQERGQTIVMITHSDEAARAASRVVHMRDGRIFEHA